MQEITIITIKYLLILILALLGYPIGNFISKQTKEELKTGKKWFKLLMKISLMFGIFFFVLILFYLIVGLYTMFSDKIIQLYSLFAISLFIFMISLSSYKQAKIIKK